MQIPETDNINFQHAFKKGYRMALEGKSPNNMPSLIRRDMEMRSYFQKGWEQAEEDIALSSENSGEKDWRGRFAWGIMMLIGGISTTLLMMHNIKEEQTEQARLIAGILPQNQNTSSTSTRTTPLQPTTLSSNSSTAAENPKKVALDLGLLSSAQRTDLAAHQQEHNSQINIPLQPIITSDIDISNAVLTSGIIDRKPGTEFNQSVPKYIREVYFYTQVEHANNQTISHRWIFNNQALATIPLEIKSDDYRTWSSKKMSSAWQGTWHVEVLNANQEVILRKSFVYGAPQ